MGERERLAEILSSSYGSASLRHYSESDDEIRFQLPAPIVDRQTAAFRTRAAALHELAISHRLSLLLGRARYALPEDFGFAIKSVETAVHSIDMSEGYDVSLHFEVLARRRDTITALESTLATRYGAEGRTTRTTFNVLPPALANFVRRTRRFLDFAEVRIGRDESCLSTVAGGHFRYYPSEDDRLSDGKRVDHVPALTLIDLALFVSGMADEGAVHANISADFLNYTDPRLAFDILQKDQTTEFVQNGQVVATVSRARA